MTDEAKLIVVALRASCSDYDDCHECPVKKWCHRSCLNGSLDDDAANLIESLSTELEQTQNKLSELLYYVTGGRFSKTDYSTDDMRRFVDDYNQSTCDECDELAELEQVKRERDAAVHDLTPSCAICVHNRGLKKWDDECNDCYDKSKWQWRGVKGEEANDQD